MQRVTLGETGIASSRLGFGAASLGSRVEAAAGRQALEAAFAEGVTWLDLAPVYGGGAAEAIAAPFVRAHRAGLQICTKAGLGLAGGTGGGLRRRLMPLARRVLSLAGPAVAGRLRGAAPKANAKLPLTPALLTASLEASLTRLGIETVDLFALHAPDPAEVGRPDILRALEDLQAAGKAQAIGVAGDAAAAAAALEAGGPYGVIQMAVPEAPADGALLSRAAAQGVGVILHSVFGRGGPASPAEGEARLARALALNPEGIVLVSMLSERSRRATLAALDRATAPERSGRGEA